MTKKMKPLYATTTAKDATSTASIYPADMKEILIPEYIVFTRLSFPVICRNFEHALDYARRQSKLESTKGEIFRVFDVNSGLFVATYKNNVTSDMMEGGEE